MSSKTTLTDIANALGISVATVHRAINEQGRINEATKQQILEKAREMNYPLKSFTSLASIKRSIAFVCPNNFFYQEIISGAKASTYEHKAWNISTHFLLSDDYSTQAQIEQLNEIIKSSAYDGLVISPTHTMLLNPLIQSLAEKNIPTVTVNNDLQSSSRACFVGEDSYMAGRMAAELYSSILPGGSKVAVMQSLVSAEGLKHRIDGFCDYIRTDKRLALLGIYDFYDNLENAFETAKQIIENTDANGIFVNSMIGTIGVLRAIRDQKPQKTPFIIGFDFNEEIKEGIEQDLLFGTLVQSPYRQGYDAIKVIYKIMINDNKQLKRDLIHIPTQLIIKSNIKQTKYNYSLKLDTELYGGDIEEL